MNVRKRARKKQKNIDSAAEVFTELNGWRL